MPSTYPPTPIEADKPATVQPPAQPAAQELADPVSGGNYLRDPATGALSVNPYFETPQE